MISSIQKHDTADEHIIDVIDKVFARNSTLIMAVVDNGPQLTSLRVKAFANHANILLQMQDIHCASILWIVLQQLTI